MTDPTRQVIRRMLTEQVGKPLHYTDYGHGRTGVAWALIDGQIVTQDDPEYTEAKWSSDYTDANFHMWATGVKRANFHGRHDPEEEVVTLFSARSFYSAEHRSEFKLKRIAAMLKAKWPGTEVLYFKGHRPPTVVEDSRVVMRRMLTEAKKPKNYMEIGHHRTSNDNVDSWKWTDGEFTFASKEGVPAEKFHTRGLPQFAGRIDHEKRMASITPWAFDPRMAERKAAFVAKGLAKHLPDDYEMWYFPHGQTSEGEPGSRIL